MIDRHAQLYKGFIITDNKKAIEKFAYKSSKELRTYEEVKGLDEYGGVLDKDTILIDIDDMEQSNILFNIVKSLDVKCLVLESRKGMHFLFKNNNVDSCHTKINFACGIIGDVKCGFKNSYEVLKIEGEERKILYDKHNDNDYDKLPKWLYPVSYAPDFINMSKGDGRNQELFNYILNLQSNGFSKDECRQCIKIINKYVLAEPLSDDEVDVILRDDAFKKEVFFEKNAFQHNRFGEYLISEYSIKRLNGQLHICKDGVYQSGHKNLENCMIKILPTIKSSQRTEVIKYIDAKILENEMAEDYVHLIPFKNGVYNLRERKLEPFDAKYIVTNRINYNYSPSAYDNVTDDTLNKIACNDKAIRLLLEECIGYCFYRDTSFQKAFILTGKGSNGKSTYLETLKRLLGQENISQLDLCEIGERFSTVTMADKLANIGDDISDEFIDGKNIAIFKKLVTGNGVKAELKGVDAFFYKPYCKLLFSANDIPSIKNKGFGAIKRRLIIIPFDAEFKRNDVDYDRNIEYKLRSDSAMEYLVKIGIDALNRILDNNEFTKSEKSVEELEKYEIQNNPLLSWMDELSDDEYYFKEDVSTIHKNYQVYCYDNGYNPLVLREFSKQLKNIRGFETQRRTINGKKMTFYIECRN